MDGGKLTGGASMHDLIWLGQDLNKYIIFELI